MFAHGAPPAGSRRFRSSSARTILSSQRLALGLLSPRLLRAAPVPFEAPTRPTLQSVTIALDILDALAGDARAQPQRARPARRRGQEHRSPHVLGAGRARAARPHAGRRLPPRPALRRVRPPRRRAHGRPRPGPAAARRAAQHARRDRADRGAGGRRRRLRRARRGPAGPALHDRTHGARRSTARAPARCSPPTTPRCSRLGCGPGWRRAPATRSSCPTSSWPSWPASATRGWARSVDETELGMSSLAVPVRSAPDGPVVAAISMVGPTTRVVGDHEEHHVAVLRAGARS